MFRGTGGQHVECIGMNDDKKRLSDVDRRSMRILATSTKAAGPANARIAERLEKAAGTGDKTDYLKAEESFDALPGNERRRIGSHAEKQAFTQRQLEESRRQRAAVPKVTPPARPNVDDTLDWKPLVMDHSPATDPAPPVPQPPASSSTAAKPAGVPGQKPTAGEKPATGQKKAAGTRPNVVPPPKPTRVILSVEPEEAVEQPVEEDSDGSWDWKRIPDDPTMKSKGAKKALDPIEELRRQMLGDDTKRR